MTIAQVCIVVPMLCYLGAAIDFAIKGNLGMTIVFACYAGANYGLILATK